MCTFCRDGRGRQKIGTDAQLVAFEREYSYSMNFPCYFLVLLCCPGEKRIFDAFHQLASAKATTRKTKLSEQRSAITGNTSEL